MNEGFEERRAQNSVLHEEERLLLHTSEAFHAIMSERDLTMTEIARRLGETLQSVREKLSGDTNLKLRTAARLAFVMGHRMEIRLVPIDRDE